jgi:hypothetical protein
VVPLVTPEKVHFESHSTRSMLRIAHVNNSWVSPASQRLGLRLKEPEETACSPEVGTQ